ncbi:hypothetical protein LJR231_001577 [Phyllobacterium sp. LjRoot231]|uniref:portal protein n=1 Tax=Phyllobacterium sp. LjRoot231 TaxID=3342289 RepID=UPI003ECFCDE6
MFDLQATDGSVRKKAYDSPIPADKASEPAITDSKLDAPEMVELHHQLLDIYLREIDRQHDNRIEQAVEEDFYDNIQWKEEDAQTLRDRGQLPLVYNVISASVDWITGTEKKTRTDYKILPRREEDSKPAERKTALMKYLSDVNRTPFHRSRAFEDAVKVGIGWLEDGATHNSELELIYSRYESWRNMLWDSAATELDLTDARFIFRSKWLDLDVSHDMFKERIDLLNRSAAYDNEFIGLDQFGDEAMDQQEMTLERNGQSTRSDSVTGGYQRKRVRVIEGWIKRPCGTDRLKGGMFGGEVYDARSVGHRESVESGEAEIVTQSTMRMHVIIFTELGLLWHSPSPYRHNKFPFTPIWAYRRGRDGLPYGMIRRLKDIQEDINKRASKALHILSTNKTIMEKGAVDDLDEYIEEVARPDGVLVVNANKRLELNVDRDLSQHQLELMSRSIAMVQQASGVTDESMGRTTNASSGIAIKRRQDQGSMASAKYFDNLLFASQVQGEKQLSLVEQFMEEKKAFRITNSRGTAQFIKVNDGEPENDIVRSKADFIISEEDWHATQREAAVDALMLTMQKFPPEVTLVMLDLIVENMDLPNREEIVKRIRGMTGQRDPDAGNEMTPEEQAKAEAAQKQQQLQEAGVMAALKKALADVAKTEADTLRLNAQTEQITAQTTGTNIDALVKALTAALQTAQAPQIAPIADHILNEAGFVGKPMIDGQVAPPQQQLPPPQAQPGAPQPGQPSQQPGLAPGLPPQAPAQAQQPMQADLSQQPGLVPA